VNAVFQAIPFRSYREIGLDIWGEKGRLSLMQESLGIYHYPRVQNRAIQDEWEVATDQPRVFAPTCGRALYRMYDNLADVLTSEASLWSPGEEALKVEKIIQELLSTCAQRP
jgi:predicted dehydrogenase